MASLSMAKYLDLASGTEAMHRVLIKGGEGAQGARGGERDGVTRVACARVGGVEQHNRGSLDGSVARLAFTSGGIESSGSRAFLDSA